MTVNPVNDPPVAQGDAYETMENSALTILASGGVMNVRAGNADQLYGVGAVLYADFGASGLWKYEESKWAIVSEMNAEGMTSVGSTLYIDSGAGGVYQYASGKLTALDTPDPELLYGTDEILYADFGVERGGVYSFDGKAWTSLGTEKMDAQEMALAGRDFYVDFGLDGLGRYYAGAWQLVTKADAEGMAPVGSALYVDFGASGISRVVASR